jgi:hypothetical protein
MVARRINDGPAPRRRAPALTPEGREKQIAAAAYDLAEKQILDGTASSQVLTHFLKAVSSREMLEQERIARENELLEAKKEAMQSAARLEELMTEAMNAFRGYAGQGPIDDRDYDD